MTIITGEEGLRRRRTGRRSSARRERAASARRSWRTRRSVSPACTAAPHDSAPGLQGRRRYINIQRAEWGTTPHAGSGGVETPTIKVRGPLEHVPSFSFSCSSLPYVPSHAPCMCTYSPPRVRLTLVHRPMHPPLPRRPAALICNPGDASGCGALAGAAQRGWQSGRPRRRRRRERRGDGDGWRWKRRRPRQRRR